MVVYYDLRCRLNATPLTTVHLLYCTTTDIPLRYKLLTTKIALSSQGQSVSYLHNDTSKEGHDPDAPGVALLVDVPADEGAGEHLADGHDGRDAAHELLVRLQHVG